MRPLPVTAVQAESRGKAAAGFSHPWTLHGLKCNVCIRVKASLKISEALLF